LNGEASLAENLEQHRNEYGVPGIADIRIVSPRIPELPELNMEERSEVDRKREM
jgi:hypothetical protein